MKGAMLEEVLAFAWTGRHPHLLERRRAEAIVMRVRVFAALFAVMTVAWIALDAYAFRVSVWLPLAGARIVTASLFAMLALACKQRALSLGQARARLAALFAVPAAFFFAALALFPAEGLAEVPRGVAAAYCFVPFVLAAGIGAFPLAATEAAALAAFALAIELAALASPWREAIGFNEAGALWLLFLISIAAGFAALSQLRLLAALAHLAMRDPLTGCLRRESGGEMLEWQFLVAARQRVPLAILFADIDRFKDVNDTYGHEAGDEVLANTAASLRALSRESDVLVRWGGEEFVLALPHTSREEAVALIGRMRAQGFGRRPGGAPVTLSIGVAEYPSDACASAAELVVQADRRMYLAKQAGRNRYVAYGAESVPILAESRAAEAPAAVPATSSTVSR